MMFWQPSVGLVVTPLTDWRDVRPVSEASTRASMLGWSVWDVERAGTLSTGEPRLSRTADWNVSQGQFQRLAWSLAFPVLGDTFRREMARITASNVPSKPQLSTRHQIHLVTALVFKNIHSRYSFTSYLLPGLMKRNNLVNQFFLDPFNCINHKTSL